MVRRFCPLVDKDDLTAIVMYNILNSAGSHSLAADCISEGCSLMIEREEQ